MIHARWLLAWPHRSQFPRGSWWPTKSGDHVDTSQSLKSQHTLRVDTCGIARPSLPIFYHLFIIHHSVRFYIISKIQPAKGGSIDNATTLTKRDCVISKTNEKKISMLNPSEWMNSHRQCNYNLLSHRSSSDCNSLSPSISGPENQCAVLKCGGCSCETNAIVPLRTPPKPT